MRDVMVVCRELHCGDAVAVSRGPLIEYGRGGVTLFSCSGDESIRQCVIRGPGDCYGEYYHHVTCSESVRLVDGAGLCSGRVEVKSNQSWASVCEADFDRQDAEVVCGELGCGAPAALQGGSMEKVRVRPGIKSSSVKAKSPFSWTVTPQTEKTTPVYLVMLLDSPAQSLMM
ncbi:scavenger receptor cysteine-rich domain-containing group B protein-like [Salmo salar]|uniref:Scavenger receptor cysteine-rich domain-containing group B protein-like n=1 Tax=Salmo salar TaxID=8030 RepID=A0ABM3ECY7_SALSA|nr:scavenger receptor cysteine-rich domain-containing group B protein-like [Salmo salar]